MDGSANVNPQWTLSPFIDLCTTRVPRQDGLRQQATAAEICTRLAEQPGLILADDVGMGKTFVALAVAASVAQQGEGRQVVVMVPSAVADKWPSDWSVFYSQCLKGGPEIRATERTIKNGADLLKLLDDPPERRTHIIFLSHWALTANLSDPFIKLALVRTAFSYQRHLSEQRDQFPRWAAKVLDYRHFDEKRVEALLASPPEHWRKVWNRCAPDLALDDDPIPSTVIEALENADFSALRETLGDLPLRSSSGIDRRLKVIRKALRDSLNDLWRDALRQAKAHLPLLILDEAHHLKNPNQLRSLFDVGDGDDAESIAGTFGNVFERMLLLTATPFQLGHRELVAVLRLFKSTRLSESAAQAFDSQIDGLNQTLDLAQAQALRLERLWGQLRPDDLLDLPEAWWTLPPANLADRGALRAIAACVSEARQSLAAASIALKPWVIRHTRIRNRSYLAGRRTVPEHEDQVGATGLAINHASVLPFLLAARAQAHVSLCNLHESRPTRAWFADGLASSFEAFSSTRKDRQSATDETEDTESGVKDPEAIQWYIERIEESLSGHDTRTRASHPKIEATVRRAVHHWRQGEKVLIFCFYRATGRALQEHVSSAIAAEIAAMARPVLRMSRDADVATVIDALNSRAESILRRDGPGGRRLLSQAHEIAAEVGLDENDQHLFGTVMLRFMRTPSFSVRYLNLSDEGSSEAAVEGALDRADGSGLTLGAKLEKFAGRIKELTPIERKELWEHLQRLSTGLRRGEGDAEDSATNDIETPELGRLAAVRLANGETAQALRRRLMLTFNTPFLPEVLVASSVMAEGVDLHRECRHVIHHDLDWNPSMLEQRNGRIERLGSKAAATSKPIIICEPFMSGTQDEKRYRVVKDREHWFGVVMGGRVPQDEWATDRIAQRVPMPDGLMDDLAMNLGVYRDPES